MKRETLKRKAEEFHRKFDTELKGNYIRLSEYTGAHEPLTALHIPCGEVRTAAAQDFFRKGCPICARKEAQKNRANKRADGYIKQIEKDYDVTALSEYTGPRDPIKWRCNKCGAVIERTVENILWRHGYGGGMQHDCYDIHKRLIRILKKRLHQVEPSERKQKNLADRLEEIDNLCAKYKNNGYQIIKVFDDLDNVIVKHMECGRKFKTDKDRMKKGYGCKVCAKKGLSFGVEQIRTYLENNAISYKREVCFNSCKLEKPLPFDFIIYDRKEKPIYAIEFNGEQHYRQFKYFGGADKFAEIQAADKVKAEWCKDNGLPFLSIRYDENITDKLNKCLKLP